MSAIEEVRELDRRRIKAMTQKDIGALDKILADDLIYIHSNAKKDNKKSLINAMLSGAATYRQIDVQETDVRDFGETVTLIGTADLIVSVFGERQAIRVRFTNVYVKRDERWQMAVWQETLTPP